MASNFGSLIKEAMKLLDEFSSSRLCEDDFIEQASNNLQHRDPPHKKFILDVVSGCIEHKQLLDVVINVFCGQNGKWLTRGDRSQFVVVCYLLTFSLDDVGLQGFSNIIKSLDVKKMHTFLMFFFTNLTTWIQEEWNHIYDASYVETNWINPLLRWRPEMDALMEQLAVRIQHGSNIKKAPTRTTQPQEFSLTKPKPRPLPRPELIPLQEKSKPVPSSTYQPPRELHIMEEIKQKNRQKTEELLYEANIREFRCANPPKPDHTKYLDKTTMEGETLNSGKAADEPSQRAASQNKEDSKPKRSSPSSGRPGSNETSSWPIRLNRTAILRQGAMFSQQEEAALQRIQHLVEGSREPSSFLQWQKEMRERDLQEELAKIECRRLEGHLSSSEEIRATVRERNQKAAQQKKEETAQLMRRFAETRLQEDRELRDLVQQVAEGHKNSKAAKEKLQKLKQSIVKEVSEQSQELLRQALEETQAELSRKCQIISEIHAIESLPHVRFRAFDDTEDAGHGMSLMELRERLARLKKEQQEEQQERRERILEEKQKDKQLLLDKMDAIHLHTRALAKAKAARKEEKKTKASPRDKVLQDQKVVALQKKLQEKQRMKQIERLKVKTSEARNTETDSKKFSAGQSWEELELRLQRQVHNEPPYLL